MKYILLALLIPVTLYVSAQEGTGLKNVEKYPKVKWKKKLKIARKLVEDGSYYNAAQYLEDAYKEKPDKIDIAHLLGEANRILRDYEAAEKYYKVVIDKDPDAFPSDGFYLGQMQKMNGKYEDARKSFENYNKVSLGKGDKNLKSLAKVEIEGIDTAGVLTKNPTKVRVEKIETGVNTPIQDFSPKALKNNRVLFSSMKTDTAVNVTTTKSDYYSAIFIAERSGKNYINKTALPTPPNEAKLHTGNAIFSADENTLIYTRCDTTELVRMDCKLYRSTKSGAEWGNPEELKGLNAEEGTTTHPAWGVDADGNQILYFASDRSGNGGMDIFYAKANTDGTFGGVVSAGDAVNTAGDDQTPFYDNKNKMLYFSSDGHPTLGGYDVFRVSGTPGHWGGVSNAGVPINSPANDIYFALDEKSNRGFLVSNRIGTTSARGATCCNDIWSVIVRPEIVLRGVYVKRGDATNTPIEGVDASLYKVVGNNFEFVTNSKTTNVPFIWPVLRNTSYKINGNKEGYWPSIDNVTVSEDEEKDTLDKIFYLDPIIKIHIKIPNVYFAFDKSNVLDFYKGQIDSVVRVLNEHPAYSVEIQGHTDSKGTDEYNEKLSMRRANEVKNFLIKDKKIAENRVVTKWFGEKQPAVPNELPNGEDDPEGRARNRRVEFKVIPDKPEDAPEFEGTGEVIPEVKTGPGFTTKPKKK